MMGKITHSHIAPKSQFFIILSAVILFGAIPNDAEAGFLPNPFKKKAENVEATKESKVEKAAQKVKDKKLNFFQRFFKPRNDQKSEKARAPKVEEKPQPKAKKQPKITETKKDAKPNKFKAWLDRINAQRANQAVAKADKKPAQKSITKPKLKLFAKRDPKAKATSQVKVGKSTVRQRSSQENQEALAAATRLAGAHTRASSTRNRRVMSSIFGSRSNSSSRSSTTVARSNSQVVVSVKDQRMALVQNGRTKKVYRISTSKFGLGDQNNSYRTPLGHMQVYKKIGTGAPAGAVFKHRQRTGEVLKPNAPGRDPIVTRILWLDGLESKNRNAKPRCIYIHGTPEERTLGSATSYGCIRMRSKDIIDLYAKIPVGTDVFVINDDLSDARAYAARAVRRAEIAARTKKSTRKVASANTTGQRKVAVVTRKRGS